MPDMFREQMGGQGSCRRRSEGKKNFKLQQGGGGG